MLMAAAWGFFTFISPPSAADRWPRMLAIVGIMSLFASCTAMLWKVRREARGEQTWWTITIVFFGLAATASVGRPKDELGALGTFLGAIAATLVSLRYFFERDEARQRDRRARRDAFCADWTKLLSDKQSVRVIHMLEKNDPELDKLGQTLLQVEYDGWKYPLDQLLAQLQRIAFAVDAGDMDDDVANQTAGWYFAKVADHVSLRRYCQMHGFKPLADYADILVKSIRSTQPSAAATSH
jgi:hypothetical protein